MEMDALLYTNEANNEANTKSPNDRCVHQNLCEHGSFRLPIRNNCLSINYVPCTAGDDVLPLHSGFFKNNLSDKHFPFSILFTDVMSFTSEEVFNTHNTKAWAIDNTYGARTGTAQHCFTVNV
ncbi:hypothetical protein CEXT_154141 [Caerostris extrusa]|uniref:Guanylate cyclase domain-containing protein n=1 Tax=Caerostris extrusa TaxID=172846 RepID=A0AAV4R9X8_CAEEX|nr:hypothetical protein CEXT_154141 [Caerostris extrusa]